MGKRTKEIQPWTDPDGNILDLAEIKRKSVSWTPDIWSAYLDTVDQPLKESQISKFDEAASSLAESVFVHSQSNASEEIKKLLQQVILTLNDQQREVVEQLFFNSRTQREVALGMSISQSRVRDLKHAALKNLKTFFQGALTFPIVTDQTKTMEMKNVKTNFETTLEDDSEAS